MCNLRCSSGISTRSGPLVFLIYVNDIQYAITTPKIKLFAYDTNLLFHSKDTVKLFTLANACMLQLFEWFKANKLSLNIDKNCFSAFGPNYKKIWHFLCKLMAK